MTGHDDLRHGAHAAGVAAKLAEHAVFGRSLIGGACLGYIDAVLQADTHLGGYAVGFGAQTGAVDLGHVGEAGTEFLHIGTYQGIGHEVDVVGDDHQVAHAVVGVQCAGGVAYEKRFDAHAGENPFGVGDLLHGVAFIVVEAALHGHNLFPAEGADDEVALVSYGGGALEVRYLRVGDDERVLYAVGQLSEAAAEHDGGVGEGVTRGGDALLQVGGCLCMVHCLCSCSICFCISAARS